MQRRPYRSLLILIAIALLIIPAAVTLFNDRASLTGTAVQQSISQSDSPEDTSSDKSESSGEESRSNEESDSGEAEPASEESGADESASDEAEESSDEPADVEADNEPKPTADAGNSKAPTPAPTDDETESAEATEEASGDSSDDNEQPEATEEASNGDDEQPEATEEVSSGDDAQPEATEEPTAAPEATEEPALEVTAEATPELLPEATAEPLALDVALVCGSGGVAFTVTNAGADMTSAESYRIDGEDKGEFQLAAGESTTISAGFGTPLFSTAGISAQPDEPCLPPPALEVSAVCTAEAGATFVISNSGGPMPEAQAYTLDGETAGEFQLGEGETAQIEAGYGSPVFASGDLSAALEEACNPPGSIGGEVWLDVDGDGTRGDDEAAIAEAVITLTDSAGSTQETISDEEGRYAFIHLLPGDYTVEIKDAPDATRPSHDAEGEADSSANITVAFEAIRADFGYQPLGSIGGVVWLDVNGDGARGEDETGIAGVTISLIYEGSTQETVSADDGRYGFADLPYGDYTVQIASAPVDTLPTYDAEGEADSSAFIRLSSAGASADFGYQAIIKPAISGVVWADLNGDGVRDEGEPGLGNIPVLLTGSLVEAQAVTDASGAYGFVDLAAGEYHVSIASDALAENYTVTADASASALTLADEPITSVNFGLQPARLGSISGLIWLETSDFGVRNAGETGIAGVIVELVNSAGIVVQRVTLEADGRYTFSDQIAGTYSVRISEESLPDRLFVTYNPDGSSAFSTQVTLPPGVDVESVEFGLVGAF